MLMAISVIKKRDGRIVPFDVQKISDAIEKSFRADEPERDHRDLSDSLAWEVYSLLDLEGDPAPTVEHVQDIVEQVLMREGYSQTAKSYILYRQERTNIRNRDPQGRGTVTLSPPDAPTTFVDQALSVYRAVRDNGGCERLEGFYAAMTPGVADEFRREYANLLCMAISLCAGVDAPESLLHGISLVLENAGRSLSLGENETYLAEEASMISAPLFAAPELIEKAQQAAVPLAREIIKKRTRRTVRALLRYLDRAGCPLERIIYEPGDSAESRLLREILAG